MWGRVWGRAVLALTLLVGGIACAADLIPPPQEQNTVKTAPVSWLFGDWGGSRTALQWQGIDFQFGYANEIAYNARGGITHEVAYADQYVAGATFDLDRLFGLHRASFQVTVTERTGRNLSDDVQLGTLQQVQEVFGRGQTVRLSQFWFDQKYLDGLIDWKIGRMGVGEDFAAFACDFQNLTFCGSNPGNVVGNYIFNWPISQWATRFKFTLNGFGYVEVGVYDENPKYLGVRDELAPVFFSGSTGILIPVELAWLPKFGDGKLLGSYKFGGWADTSTAPDVVDAPGTVPATNPGVPVAQSRGRFGGYVNFQQQITRNSTANPEGGLSLFLNAVMADNRTASTNRQIAAGAVYTGPLSWRPDDDVAFAVSMTHVNNRGGAAEALANALGLGPVPVQGSEYAFELCYTVRPVPGLLFRPNLQYVLNPGGTNQNKDAIVLGLKVVANF
jgi:porin